MVGDFNLRQGEDQVLLDEGWRDSALQFAGVERSEDWTWARGEFQARYDRVYTHAGEYAALDCLRCATLPGYIEAGLSDHKPVCVEMRRTDTRAQAALPDRSVPKGGGRGSLRLEACFMVLEMCKGRLQRGATMAQEWWQL